MHARVWQTRDSEGVATWRESKYQAQAGADSVVAFSLRAVMVSRRGRANHIFAACCHFRWRLVLALLAMAQRSVTSQQAKTQKRMTQFLSPKTAEVEAALGRNPSLQSARVVPTPPIPQNY